MSKRLFVIDGMAFAFRSYFAIPHLRDSRGNPTNAVYGFARVLLKILREEQPSHLVLVFDAPGKVFREDLFPDYKKTRKETPEDLLAQFPVIDRLAEAFEIPVLRVPSVEADDVMGTLSKRAEQWGVHTVLVTNDKDMLQLVNGNTSVYDPNKGDKGKWYDAAAVRERYGVGPEAVIEVLGLIGDSVDNVPGVKGIGEKTARTLLEKYGTIQGIYDKIHELKGKQKERLLESRDTAMLSRQLVTIDTAVEFECD
ncbi:MAG: 5'-3' exonuclease H3TH domain-containing protein, partial [Candidatus Hydrogenedentales bacterium]